MIGDTDWIIVGNKVAVYRYGYAAGYNTANIQEIVKLTATAIVLEDGSRYRRDNKRPTPKFSSSYERVELLPIKDPRVQGALSLANLRMFGKALETRIKNHKGSLQDSSDVLVWAQSAIDMLNETIEKGK